MKEKFYSMYGKAVDENGAVHYVTVVGKFEQYKETVQTVKDAMISTDEDSRVKKGTIIVPLKTNVRNLILSYSICHPIDTFDVETGIEIAKSRIKRGGTIGTLTSSNITMLNEDQANLIVFGELQYIINNIDMYIPEPCEDYDPNDKDCQECPRAPQYPTEDDEEESVVDETPWDDSLYEGNEGKEEEKWEDSIFDDDFDDTPLGCEGSNCSLGICKNTEAPSFDDLEDLRTDNL